MSDFIESIDAMIASHFTDEAMFELKDTSAWEIKDWNATTKILRQTIRA